MAEFISRELLPTTKVFEQEGGAEARREQFSSRFWFKEGAIFHLAFSIFHLFRREVDSSVKCNFEMTVKGKLR